MNTRRRTIKDETPEWELLGEPVQRLKKINCDALTEADWRQFLELQIPEDPDTGCSSCMCEFYLQKLNQVLIIDMRKNSLIFPA